MILHLALALSLSATGQAAGRPVEADLSARTVQSTGSTTARKLKDRFADVVNVKDFGAKGDGVSDDTAAIQGALTVGGNVVFPVGVYVVKDLVVSVPNTTVSGTIGATLKLAALSAHDGSPILDVKTTGVTIRDLALDGNKANQPADGFSDSFAGGAYGTGRAYRAAVKADGGSSTVSNLTVRNCAFSNTYGAAVATMNVSQLYVLDNTDINGNFELIDAVSTVGQTDAIVSRNWMQNLASGNGSVQSNGIVLHDYARVVVSGNQGNTVERNFVKLEGATDAVISGNSFHTNTIGNFGAIQTQNTIANLTISGNTVSNTGAGITLNSTQSDRVLVSGNTIDTTTGPSTGDGVVCASGPFNDLQIVGNILTNLERHGVYLAGTGTRVSVEGNHLTGSGGSGQRGLLASASTGSWADLDISGNYFADFQQISSGDGVVAFLRSSTYAFANVTIRNNVILAGASTNRGLRSASASGMITSGVATGNYVDGIVELGTQTLPAYLNIVTGSNLVGTAGGSGTVTLSAGTGTTTVVSGCRPLCTDTSNANAVKCSVSGTTLTATGTGTDAINFLCM